MARDLTTARRLYRKLLTFYPRAFRERFGESMLQTFNDLCNERQHQSHRTLPAFVLWTFIETTTGILTEYVHLFRQGNAMQNILSNPKSAASIGFALTLPVILLNTIANHEIEPFFTFFKINTAGSFWNYPVGYLSVILALLLLPMGATIAIQPMLAKGSDGKRKFYLLNVLLAVIMFALFVIISGALISEIYASRT